jgi:tetratricopeptide (TPR) repeat protein
MEVATVLLVNSQEATEKAKKAHGQALAVQNSLNYKSEQEQAKLLASNTEVEMLLKESKRLKSLYAILFINSQQSLAEEQNDKYYQGDDSAFMSPAQAEFLEKHYVSRLNFVMNKWGYSSQVHVRNNEEFLRRAQSNLERVEADPSRYQNEIVDKENQVRTAQVDVAIARKDALFYFQTVLDLKRELFSDNNAETIKSMRELGELYTEFNEFEEAEKLLDESLVLNIKLHGGKHLNTSDSFTALADLFQSQGAFETAAQFNLEALKIKQELLNNSDVSLFKSLSWQANLLIKSGSYESAERYARDSLDSALIIYTKNHLKTAAEYYKYALVLHNLDRYPEAEKNYIEALDIEWNRNNDSTDYFMIMQHFADLYDEWDKPLKYDLLRTAHDGREKLSPELLEQMLNQ